jgi:hypothetical protein
MEYTTYIGYAGSSGHFLPPALALSHDLTRDAPVIIISSIKTELFQE